MRTVLVCCNLLTHVWHDWSQRKFHFQAPHVCGFQIDLGWNWLLQVQVTKDDVQQMTLKASSPLSLIWKKKRLRHSSPWWSCTEGSQSGPFLRGEGVDEQWAARLQSTPSWEKHRMHELYIIIESFMIIQIDSINWRQGIFPDHRFLGTLE